MPKQDFIPRPDDAFKQWHNELTTEAPAVPGFAAGAALATLQANDAAINAKIPAALTASQAAKQANEEKDVARRAAEAHARNLARQFKAKPGYTVAAGEQLGIEGPEDTTDLSAASPPLKARALPHAVVELQFVKSKSDGVNLYSWRDGDAGFAFLARDTASPYIDNRPCLVAGKPETRKYKAIYVVNDAEIGQASDEVVVTCQP